MSFHKHGQAARRTRVWCEVCETILLYNTGLHMHMYSTHVHVHVHVQLLFEFQMPNGSTSFAGQSLTSRLYMTTA